MVTATVCDLPSTSKEYDMLYIIIIINIIIMIFPPSLVRNSNKLMESDILEKRLSPEADDLYLTAQLRIGQHRHGNQ